MLPIFTLSAQENTSAIDQLEEKYTAFFNLSRETVYLHLNKTVLLEGEDLWFAAYAYHTKQKKADTLLTNLKVATYDTNGILIDNKTILINKGKGAGHFVLAPKKYLPGNYKVIATTHYMNNFEEDLSFSQNFTIVGSQEQPEKKAAVYDLQLLPEGGHLLANVTNTVGVKLLDSNAKGISFTNGKIVDAQNNIVTTFTSNLFGMAKFLILPKAGETYTAVLTANGKTVEQPMPQAENQGLTMTVNTQTPNQIYVSVATNPATIERIKGEDFIVAIHQKGVMKVSTFSLAQDKLEHLIKLPYEELFPGVNTLTVFNKDLQPLLERLVYNYNPAPPITMAASVKENLGDSLQISLQTNPLATAANISISVLPSKTKAYQPQHNILSAFTIQPYIKGTVENGTYYFQETVPQRKRNYDIDLLMLTQGWSKYTWPSVFNNPPKELFEAQQGFTLEGKVLNKLSDKESKLLVTIPNSDASGVVTIYPDHSFKAANVFVQDSMNINIALFNDRTFKFTKPTIYLNLLPAKTIQNLKRFDNLNADSYITYNTITPENNTVVPDNFVVNSTILDTVMLKGENRKDETRKIIKGVFVTEEIFSGDAEDSQSFVTTYLRNNGFDVDANNVVISRRTRSFTPSPALIYMDGAPIDTESHSFYLRDLRIQDVESIRINRSGSGAGGRGFGGVIEITTRRTLTKHPKSTMHFEYVTPNGFASEKEFYAPKYVSYTNPVFEEYGVIGWFPSVSVEKGKNNSFKILNTLQPEVTLFIEGMTENGQLISQEVQVKTN